MSYQEREDGGGKAKLRCDGKEDGRDMAACCTKREKTVKDGG